MKHLSNPTFPFDETAAAKYPYARTQPVSRARYDPSTPRVGKLICIPCTVPRGTDDAGNLAMT